MPKYKIIYDKEICIGCQNCVSVCPNNWEKNKDKVNPKKVHIENNELINNKEAEEACPVEAIKIKKIED